MAEGVGFEPTKLLKVYRVSNPAHSTTLPPFQNPLRRRDRIRTHNLPLYAKKGALPVELHAANFCQCLKPLTRLTGLDLPVFPTRFIRTHLFKFSVTHISVLALRGSSRQFFSLGSMSMLMVCLYTQ